MSEGKSSDTWQALRQERVAEPAARAGYDAARRAFQVGEQVRRLRQAQGLSQAELAGRLGTSQSAIARLEAGGVDPKIETLDRIGHALGADLVVELRPREPATT